MNTVTVIIIIADTAVYLVASDSPFNTQLRGYLLSVVFPNLQPLQTELMVLSLGPTSALCVEQHIIC